MNKLIAYYDLKDTPFDYRTHIDDDVRQAWLEQAGTIAVDIETNTVMPNDAMQYVGDTLKPHITVDDKSLQASLYPDSKSPIAKSWGLLAMTNILSIALYSPEMGYTLLVEGDVAYEPETKAWLKQLFSEPREIIGHNVVFDLRLLGMTYDFLLTPEHRVYDTLLREHRGNFSVRDRQGNDLASLVQRHQVECPLEFFLAMKKVNKQLDLVDYRQVVKVYSTLYEANVIPTDAFHTDIAHVFELFRKDGSDFWKAFLDYRKHYDGETPWVVKFKREDGVVEYEVSPLDVVHFYTDIHRVVSDAAMLYVTMDTYMAYLVKENQDRIAQMLVDNKVVKHGDVTLLQHPEIKELFEFLASYQVLSVNWAIRGLGINIPALVQRYQQNYLYEQELIDVVAHNAKTVSGEDVTVESPNFSDYLSDTEWSFKGFHRVAITMVFFQTILEGLVKKQQDDSFTYPSFTSRDYLRENFDKDAALAYLRTNRDTFFEEGFDEEVDTWLNYLKTTSFEDIKTTSTFMKELPSVSPPPFYAMNFFTHIVGETSAQYWFNWFQFLLNQKKTTNAELVGSNKFQPLYLHAVCGIPEPTEAERASTTVLTTKKGGLSYGSKALAWYIERWINDTTGLVNLKALTAYQLYLEASSVVRSDISNLHQATFDGRLHSLVTPATRTTRNSSSQPNLQNLSMKPDYDDTLIKKSMAGYITAPDPDTFVLLELDYSNAENVCGAAISGDDAFAVAVMENDFHSVMAEAYWGEGFTKLTGAERKALRGRGKNVTFASAYGAGPTKLAAMTGIPIEEVVQMLRQKDVNFPKVKVAQELGENKAIKRHRAGVYPTWGKLYDGTRIQLPYDSSGQPVTFKLWNYLQQGSVARIVKRAAVKVNRFLHDNGYKTFVAHEVHDALIVAVAIDEYSDTDVVQEILKIMVDEYPELLRVRTVPNTRLVAEVGPENATKWGYVVGREYPLPLDEFINYWGRHKLEEGVDEAPTWRGDVANGWTLEKQIVEDKRARDYGEEARNQGGVLIVEDTTPQERDPADVRADNIQEALKTMLDVGLLLQNNLGDIKALLNDPSRVILAQDDGTMKRVSLLNIQDKVKTMDALYARGYAQQEYRALYDKLTLYLGKIAPALIEALENGNEVYSEFQESSDGE
jgi:hypothetical protein